MWFSRLFFLFLQKYLERETRMGVRDERDKTKVRKEKLAGYFFNLSQLTFTGTGIGGIAPILQGEFEVINSLVLILGTAMTAFFAFIGNRILKY